MDYASENGFVLFTHDLDFGALLASRETRDAIRIYAWPAFS